MTEQEIAVFAANGYPIADDTTPEIRALYYRLALLYLQYRFGLISAECGAQEKAAALMKFRKDRDEQMFDKKQRRHMLRFWQNTEAAANEYRLHPSIENADRLLEAIYGVGRKKKGEIA